MVQRYRLRGFFDRRRYDDEILSSFGYATGKTRTRHALRFYLFGMFGKAATVLQLYNAASLGVFWPFFAGIVWQIITALFQFARMILLLPE